MIQHWSIKIRYCTKVKIFLGSFKSDEKILLKKVLMLMLTTSDNTASLWLQSLAGKGTRVNEILDSLGFRYTRINSRTPGRENNRSNYGWGQTTPSEMGKLFEMIYRDQVFSPASCERMKRCLEEIIGMRMKRSHKFLPILKCLAKTDVLMSHEAKYCW